MLVQPETVLGWHREQVRRKWAASVVATARNAAFEDWVSKVWTLGAGTGSEVALADFRKNIIIDFFSKTD